MGSIKLNKIKWENGEIADAAAIRLILFTNSRVSSKFESYHDMRGFYEFAINFQLMDLEQKIDFEETNFPRMFPFQFIWCGFNNTTELNNMPCTLYTSPNYLRESLKTILLC